MVKSYINLAEEVSNKMIMKPTIMVKHAVQNGDYAYGRIDVLYPGVWYGTLWAVEYIVDNTKVISERCYSGAMVFTTEQDKYPKIPHEIIIDYFNNFMNNPKSHLMDIDSIDLEKELSIRNMPISVLSGDNKKKGTQKFKMQNNNYTDFINNKKEYDSSKKHNLNKKIDYIITQMDVLFRILQDINDNNQIETEDDSTKLSLKDTMPLSGPTTLSEIKKYAIDMGLANKDDEKSLKSIKDEIITELNLYSINPDYVGARLLIQLCMIARMHDITTDSDYDYMCETVYPEDINYAKRNFTFIRKKINEYNLSTKFNSNKEMLDHFIELCY